MSHHREYRIGEFGYFTTKRQPKKLSGHVVAIDDGNVVVQFDQMHIKSETGRKLYPEGQPGIDWDHLGEYVEPTTEEDDVMPVEATPIDGTPDVVSSWEDEGGYVAPAEDQATDAAFQFAFENNVVISDVPGTGKDGKVTKPDVEAYLEQKTE